MSCEKVTNLPPPPPPPLPNFSAIIPVCNVNDICDSNVSEEEALSYITRLFNNVVPDCETLPSRFKYSHINPLIQDGPTCGLVALAMISNSSSVKCDVSDLFDLAFKRGFTKKGEMFSAKNMSLLAKEVLSNKFEVIHYQGGILNDKNEIIHNLILGNLYLIPYDADKNHSPANLRGFKAHWAILCGVLENLSQTYIIGRQSKSKHVGLWDFHSLHESNMNLVEIALDKAESDDYVIDDIKTSLAGNYILMKKI